jgi:hypothetical protein
MKTIKFSDSEIDLLTQLYLDELDMAENYVNQIKAVLKKLDVPIKPVNEEPIEQELRLFKRREIKPDVKTAEKAEPKKRGRKPRSVPTPESAPLTTPEPVKKEEKVKAEPKPKKAVKAKVKAEKKPVAKRTPKPKPEEVKAPATVESVVTSLLTKAPKKKEAKVAKKKPTQRRRKKGKVKIAKLSKPITKKSPKVKVVVDNTPVAPIEQS